MYEMMWGNDSGWEDGNQAKRKEVGFKRPDEVSSGEQVVLLV